MELLRRVPQYDVLHIFSASYWSFLLAPTPAILIGRLYGRQTVLNYHSGQAEDHLTRWPSAVKTLHVADKIVVPSGYLVDVFAKWNFRAEPIFNFVDFSRFCFRERKPLRPVFLSNRNMMAMYNVGVILRAFSIIQARYPRSGADRGGRWSGTRHARRSRARARPAKHDVHGPGQQRRDASAL